MKTLQPLLTKITKTEKLDLSKGSDTHFLESKVAVFKPDLFDLFDMTSSIQK